MVLGYRFLVLGYRQLITQNQKHLIYIRLLASQPLVYPSLDEFRWQV